MIGAKSLTGVVGQFRVQARVDRERRGRHQQRVTVGRRLSRRARCRWSCRRPGGCRRTTCWPHISDNFCATVRPTMSVLPPAGNGTTSRTGLVGYVCAAAAPAASVSASATIVLSHKLSLVALCFYGGLRRSAQPVYARERGACFGFDPIDDRRERLYLVGEDDALAARQHRFFVFAARVRGVRVRAHDVGQDRSRVARLIFLICWIIAT